MYARSKEITLLGVLHLLQPGNQLHLHVAMKLLIIDNTTADCANTREVLYDKFKDFEFIDIASPEVFESRYPAGDFDLVIVEHALDWTASLPLIRRIKSRFNCVPVIMLARQASVESAVTAMKVGVADFILKSEPSRLIESVGNLASNQSRPIHCTNAQYETQFCEKWDLAISRLTSDYAYSVQCQDDGCLSYEWVTEPFCRITGYRLNKIDHDWKWLVPIHPDDQAIFDGWMSNLLAGQQATCEYRILTSTGEVRWIHDHALPIRDWTAGKVARIYGAAQDITERHLAENDLRIQHRAIESSMNGIIITGVADTDYGIIYANPAFLKMTGYAMQELLGQNCRILQNGDREQPQLQSLRKALHQGQDGYSVLRNYRRDGEMFWNEVYVSPVSDAHGRITNYIGIQNDISERIQSEHQLAASALEIQDLYDKAPCGYHSLGPDGTFIRINNTELAWLGYASDEVIGKLKFTDVITPRSQREFRRSFPRFKKVGHIEDLEFDLVSKDGNIRPVMISAIAIRDDDGNYVMSRSVVYDITDRKQIEDAQRELSGHLQVAREAERTHIAREIHDEFGSLLATLKLDTRWLAKRTPATEQLQHEKLTAMSRLLDEAMHSVKRISTELHPSILDNLGLLPAVEWLVNQFRLHSETDCVLRLPADEHISVPNDRATAIFRILQETLTNISLHAHATQVEIKLETDLNILQLTVQDNGRGIPAKYWTNPRSYGIRGMIERARHFGGEVRISGQPGEGTRVHVCMPLHPDHEQKRP